MTFLQSWEQLPQNFYGVIYFSNTFCFFSRMIVKSHKNWDTNYRVLTLNNGWEFECLARSPRSMTGLIWCSILTRNTTYLHTQPLWCYRAELSNAGHTWRHHNTSFCLSFVCTAFTRMPGLWTSGDSLFHFAPHCRSMELYVCFSVPCLPWVLGKQTWVFTLAQAFATETSL